MQTVEPPDDDLQLLLDWARNADETERIRKAAIGTGIVHLLLVLCLALMPRQLTTPTHLTHRERRVTPLVDPPFELTQKAPNKGPITKELSVQSILPSIPKPTPEPGTKARRFEPPPAPPPTKQAVVAPVPEPPKIEQAQNTPQLSLPQLPPQIQPQAPRVSETKPKLAFETPTAPKGPSGGATLPMQSNPVQEAVRELSHGGSSGVSGSEPVDLGRGAGLNLPPSAGRPRMDYELKSDAQGVDFKPYILQVLAIVRRNWVSVYPESAKLGTRGQTKLDFAIAKDGKVTKVVYSWESGSRALDLAAVSAVSMANPLPPLPPEFHGERIVLSFTFSYNMGR